MKRAFTLIELLVVIAIIAILAAILFPVFAQAKTAAKKASAISNQKQIGTAMQIYMADFDDMFPRQDDCTPASSSLNTALNSQPFNATGNGCVGPRYYFRNNHYSWQRWLMPYTKNSQIFFHPGRQRLDNLGQWSQDGELMGGFALNLSITGATNTYNRPLTAAGRMRNSWRGGNQNALPDVAGTMLLFEFSNPAINFAPVLVDAINDPLTDQVVYPMAVREFWARNFMRWDVCSSAATWNASEISNTPDDRVTFGGGIVVGFADSSAKFLPANKFLSMTPTAAEYGVANAGTSGCGASSGTYRPGVTPNLNLNYPMWALSVN